MSLEPGKSLLHYRIVDKLGEGGMGKVYLAEDSKLKRQVALKVLPSEMAGDRDRLSRFQREAEQIMENANALDQLNLLLGNLGIGQIVPLLASQL